MNPIETFEKECQELVSRYTEEVNQDIKRVRRTFNIVIIANVAIAVVCAVVLLILELAGR